MSKQGQSFNETAPVIALVAVGDMGSWLARRLTSHGARVRSVGKGRSAATLSRAKQAGVELVDDDAQMIAGADFVLSVVPPQAVVDLASRLAPALKKVDRKPVFVDCNAVDSATIFEVARIIEITACPMVDAGIFGAAPSGSSAGPAIFVAGPDAEKVMALNAFGLNITVLDAPVGGASALKCSFAGLSKGVTAIAIATALTALESGVGDAWAAQVARHMPDLAAEISHLVPHSFSKSKRWSDEMRLISEEFKGVDGDAIYRGAGGVFDHLARLLDEGAAEKERTEALERLMATLVQK